MENILPDMFRNMRLLGVDIKDIDAEWQHYCENL